VVTGCLISDCRPPGALPDASLIRQGGVFCFGGGRATQKQAPRDFWLGAASAGGRIKHGPALGLGGFVRQDRAGPRTSAADVAQ
jgi:hypothetical protein